MLILSVGFISDLPLALNIFSGIIVDKQISLANEVGQVWKRKNAKTNRVQGCREKANIKNAKTNPSAASVKPHRETATVGEENNTHFCQNELPRGRLAAGAEEGISKEG